MTLVPGQLQGMWTAARNQMNVVTSGERVAKTGEGSLRVAWMWSAVKIGIQEECHEGRPQRTSRAAHHEEYPVSKRLAKARHNRHEEGWAQGAWPCSLTHLERFARCTATDADCTFPHGKLLKHCIGRHCDVARVPDRSLEPRITRRVDGRGGPYATSVPSSMNHNGLHNAVSAFGTERGVRRMLTEA